MDNIEGYNLSTQQKLVWDLNNKLNGPLWSTCCIKVAKDLNHSELKRSLLELAQQHEILGTEFKSINGLAYPLQVLSDVALVELSFIEVEAGKLNCCVDKPVEGSELKLYIDVYSAQPNEHVIKFKASALVMDTHSLLVFVKQWLVQNEDSDIVQYIDYSDWQADVAGSNTVAVDFWLKQQTLTMPALPCEASTKEAIDWSQKRSHTIKSTSAPATYAHALSLWVALLQHFTKSNEVAVMTLLDGKVAPEFVTALGNYANRVPFVINTQNVATLAELTAQVHEQLNDLRIYQMDRPYNDKLRSIGQVGFEFYDASALADPCISVLDVGQSQLLEKLTLVCVVSEQGSSFTINYPQNMYQDEFVINLLESFAVLASKAQLSDSLDVLPLFSAEQGVKLLQEFNETADQYPQVCFHEAFEAQVIKTPSLVAVKDSLGSISYQTLNERANQIARYLISTHQVTGQRVGVCMTRNTELLCVLLGILKAGATYIALTPDTPENRMTHICADTALVLTEKTLLPHLKNMLADKVCLAFEDYQRDLSQFKSINLQLAISLDDIVYVLFTSGSTGKPKGVEVTQRGLINYLTYSANTYLKDADCAIVHTSIAFDLTVTCLFAPLVCGKYLVMVSDENGIEGLKDTLLSEPTRQLVKMTPSHLKALNAWVTSQPKDHLNIASLVVGGESLYYEDLNIFLEMIAGIKIYNEYGPTEATVGCCVYQAQQVNSGIVPIGNPIANTSLYVLNEDMQPVPPWSVGELYIGGDGLAKGYLNLADVTQARFCDNPFNPESGEKLYKTGDLVKFTYNNGFQLEFLGRNDRQIKVRSYRIELDEIESMLLTHETIQQAIVIAEKNRFNENEIIAYIVADEKLSKNDIAAHLTKSLPDYMFPNHCYFIDAIPLTSNGKADLKALNTLYVTKWTSDQDFVLPRNELETAIATYWKQALKLETVGVYDNFFELGGDSIRSVHIIGLLKDDGYELSAQDLFTNPTIDQLARKCEETKQHKQKQEDDELLDMLSELENMSEAEVAQKLKELEGA